MLKATLLRKDTMPGQENKPGLLVGFRIRGHAGFAEYGQDIVCAGASAIAQAAVLGLKDTLGSSVSFSEGARFPGGTHLTGILRDCLPGNFEGLRTGAVVDFQGILRLC